MCGWGGGFCICFKYVLCLKWSFRIVYLGGFCVFVGLLGGVSGVRGGRVSVDRLVAVEWDIIRCLREMLAKPELSVAEKVHISNSIAYHVACLNKLLVQKGLRPVDDMSLGDFIRSVEPRFARQVRAAYRMWRRRLLLRG